MNNEKNIMILFVSVSLSICPQSLLVVVVIKLSYEILWLYRQRKVTSFAALSAEAAKKASVKSIQVFTVCGWVIFEHTRVYWIVKNTTYTRTMHCELSNICPLLKWVGFFQSKCENVYRSTGKRSTINDVRNSSSTNLYRTMWKRVCSFFYSEFI